jgi:hypothetical protein
VYNIARRLIMQKKYYVYGLYKKNISYRTLNIEEGLFYIGITDSVNIYFREKNHSKESFNPHKLNIIKKYDFSMKILWEVENKEECKEREIFLINWFGLINEGGILSNIIKSNDDGIKRARKKITNQSKIKLSKSLKSHYSNKENIVKNRDRNLTVPYDIVIELIEEWAKNPLESQDSFAKRKGVSRSKFKDWLKLYKPEYVGLTKKIKAKIFNRIQEKVIANNMKLRDIFLEESDITGLTEKQIKGLYYNEKKK